MRFTTNQKLINRNSKLARYTTFGGMALLLGSLVITLPRTESGDTNILLLGYVSLALGFALAYVGAYLANRWVKEPRGDSALAKALKGFDNKHHLYSYLLPANHVLLTPSGLLVFRVKSNDGKVIVKGDKWFSPFRWSRLLFGMGQEPLGNPAGDLGAEIEAMKKLLADKMEGSPGAVPIDGYVVFTSPQVELQIEDPTVPIVRVEDLKDALRKSKRGPALSAASLERLTNVLDEETNAKTA